MKHFKIFSVLFTILTLSLSALSDENEHNHSDENKHEHECSHASALDENIKNKHEEIRALPELNLVDATIGQESSDKRIYAPLKRRYHIGMKILFLSATQDENEDSAISFAKNTFKSRGIPYDHIVLKKADGSFNTQKLPLYNYDLSPRYYAIVLSQNELGTTNKEGNYQSALTPEQWEQLLEYERRYHVRRVSLFSYPNPSIGVVKVGHEGQGKKSIVLTENAIKADAALNPEATIPLEYSYSYEAQIINKDVTSPFFYYQNRDGEKSLAGAITRFDDGREQLNLFFSQAKWINASAIIADSWINWATKGVYLGKRRIYLNAQVDDFFLRNSLWNPELNAEGPNPSTYRITAQDFKIYTDWQKNIFRDLTLNPEYRTEIAYNGQGTTLYLKNSTDLDPLFEYTKTVFTDYYWLSHTYTHANLDNTTFEKTRYELIQNINWAHRLFREFPEYHYYYSSESMVTPVISGLVRKVPDTLEALWKTGIKYVVGDNSRPELRGKDPLSARISTKKDNGFDGITIIPRHATEVYYNSSTPEEMTSEYNHRYLKEIGYQNFEDILTREAKKTTTNLLNYDPAPYMFHQANLRAFNGKDSLLSLWMESVVKELRQYSTLPVLSLKMDVLKDIYLDLEKREKCGLNPVALVENNKIIKIKVNSKNNCKFTITGATLKGRSHRVETYGPDTTTTLTIGPLSPRNLEVVTE